MLPDIALVVPTYWTRAGGQARPGDAVYDHPTPIDEVGTLPKLLESLHLLDPSRFYLLVVVAVTSHEVEALAAEKVRSLLGMVPDVTALVASSEEVGLLEGPPAMEAGRPLLGLRGYSSVRNVQLALPLGLGTEHIVAVDDDEIITDPRFLDRAVEGLGSFVGGRVVDGLGGYYLQDSSGRILLDVTRGSEAASNMFDRKANIMNAGVEMLEASSDTIVPTPFCFGGNMVFSHDLAASVFFDPSITRGEDIDYLINARLAGRWFFMNKKLRMLHAPPPGGSYKDVAWHKVVQDVLRFVYEREKLRSQHPLGACDDVTVESLCPYPGEFLGESLDEDAGEAVERLFSETSREQQRTLGLGESVRHFMDRAYMEAREGVARYPGYQEAWKQLTDRLTGDDRLTELLHRQMVKPARNKVTVYGSA